MIFGLILSAFILASDIDKEVIIQNSTDFIISFEGFRSCPYPDAGGWSVGYGSLAKTQSCLSEKQARLIVEKEVERIREKVIDQYGYIFNENEQVAIISFAYNTPRTQPAFKNQNCIEGFKNKDREKVKLCFSNYQWLRGLKIRREKEFDLFFKQ